MTTRSGKVFRKKDEGTGTTDEDVSPFLRPHFEKVLPNIANKLSVRDWINLSMTSKKMYKQCNSTKGIEFKRQLSTVDVAKDNRMAVTFTKEDNVVEFRRPRISVFSTTVNLLQFYKVNKYTLDMAKKKLGKLMSVERVSIFGEVDDYDAFILFLKEFHVKSLHVTVKLTSVGLSTLLLSELPEIRSMNFGDVDHIEDDVLIATKVPDLNISPMWASKDLTKRLIEKFITVSPVPKRIEMQRCFRDKEVIELFNSFPHFDCANPGRIPVDQPVVLHKYQSLLDRCIVRTDREFILCGFSNSKGKKAVRLSTFDIDERPWWARQGREVNGVEENNQGNTPSILRPENRHVFAQIANKLPARDFILLSRSSKEMHDLCMNSPGVQISLEMEISARNHQGNDHFVLNTTEWPKKSFSPTGFSNLLKNPFNINISHISNSLLEAIREKLPAGVIIDSVSIRGAVDSWDAVVQFLSEFHVKKLNLLSAYSSRTWLIVFQMPETEIHCKSLDGSYISDAAIANAKAPIVVTWSSKITLQAAEHLLLKWFTIAPMPKMYHFVRDFPSQQMISILEQYFTIDFSHSGELPPFRPLFFKKQALERERWILREDGEVFQCSVQRNCFCCKKPYVQFEEVPRHMYPPILI